MSRLDDGWVYGLGLCLEDEYWGGDAFATREEALAAARAEHPGEAVQTAMRVTRGEAMPCPLDADTECDRAENDEWNDGANETWLDLVFDTKKRTADGRTLLDDLQDRLEAVWQAWTDEHKLTVEVAYLENVMTHQPGAAP